MDHNIIGFTAVLCIFGGPLIAGLVWTICHYWAQVAIRQSELELKHRLLDAGMTAGEIERVVNAGRAAEASETTSSQTSPEIHKIA